MRAIAFFVLLLLLPLYAGADAISSAVPWRGPPGVTIEPSRRMRAEGIPWDHEIQVALPPSYYKTNKTYPVLWLTDGSYTFEPAVTLANTWYHLHVPEMIIVAVGTPPEVCGKGQIACDTDRIRRLYDLTPTKDGPDFEGFGSELMRRNEADVAEKSRASGAPVATEYGGAPAFLGFLVDTVRPALARRYRMSSDNVLFGDSAGGIFCVYTLFVRPQSFEKYICGSPALYWANYHLFRMEEKYSSTHKDLPASVFFGAGEDEALNDGPGGILSSMTRMAEILNARKYPSLTLHARIFPSEDHLTVIPLNLIWGLRTLWADDAGSRIEK